MWRDNYFDFWLYFDVKKRFSKIIESARWHRMQGFKKNQERKNNYILKVLEDISFMKTRDTVYVCISEYFFGLNGWRIPLYSFIRAYFVLRKEIFEASIEIFDTTIEIFDHSAIIVENLFFYVVIRTNFAKRKTSSHAQNFPESEYVLSSKKSNPVTQCL